MFDSIKVAIVDSQPIFQKGLLDSLRLLPNMTVTACDYLELVEKVDLLLLSWDWDIDKLSSYCTNNPTQKVLVIVDDIRTEYVKCLFDLDVRGIILRDEPIESFFTAVQFALNGKYYFCDSVTLQGMSGNVDNDFLELTRREKEIIKLVIEGRCNKEIASILSLANQTIRNRLSVIYKKLQMTNRSQVISAYSNRV